MGHIEIINFDVLAVDVLSDNLCWKKQQQQKTARYSYSYAYEIK